MGMAVIYPGGEPPAASRPIAFTGLCAPTTLTPGADQIPVSGTVYFGEISVPAYCTATGVGYLIGSVGGTDKAVVTLYDRNGTLLANSTVTASGTTVGTAATFQEIAFTQPIRLPGPDLYYIGVQANGTTARFRVSVIAGGRGSSTAGTSVNTASIVPTTTGAATQFAYLY